MKSRLSRAQVRLAKEFLAELLGTAVLLMFGCGCVAQSVLSNKVRPVIGQNYSHDLNTDF